VVSSQERVRSIQERLGFVKGLVGDGFLSGKGQPYGFFAVFPAMKGGLKWKK
jgi:hypothetical protein